MCHRAIHLEITQNASCWSWSPAPNLGVSVSSHSHAVKQSQLPLQQLTPQPTGAQTRSRDSHGGAGWSRRPSFLDIFQHSSLNLSKWLKITEWSSWSAHSKGFLQQLWLRRSAFHCIAKRHKRRLHDFVGRGFHRPGLCGSLVPGDRPEQSKRSAM